MVAKAPQGYRQYRSYPIKKENEARQVVTRLRKEGYSVTTREVAVKGKGTMLRIFIK